MGGCAGAVVLKATEEMKRKKPRTKGGGLNVKKRKKPHPKVSGTPVPLDVSSAIDKIDPRLEEEDEDHIMTAANLNELLTEEGITKNNHVALDYLLDVMWETDGFRMSIQREIETVFPVGVDLDEDEPKDPAEAENRIFARAKSAYEYLELASKVIEYLSNKEISHDEADEQDPSVVCNNSKIVFGDNESISVRNLSRLCNSKLILGDLNHKRSIPDGQEDSLEQD